VYNSDGSIEYSSRIVQRTGSNPNPNVLHRPYSSRPNVDRTIDHNSAFHGSSNIFEPISARPRLTKSSSSILMARKNILDKSIPGASFRSNDHRQTLSRAGLMKNASATPVNRPASLSRNLGPHDPTSTMARSFPTRQIISTNPIPGRQPLNTPTFGNNSQSQGQARSMITRRILQKHFGNTNTNRTALFSTLPHSTMRQDLRQVLQNGENDQLYSRRKSDNLLITGNTNTLAKNSAQQSHNENVNVPSVVGGSVSLMSETTSSVLSSPTRRIPHQTLADQIYSRTLIEDTQSVGSYCSVDPPGADGQHLTEYLSEQFSDGSSYDTFGDDQESYVELCDNDEESSIRNDEEFSNRNDEEFSIRNDPPDPSENDQYYRNVTSDKSESCEGTEEFEESYVEREDAYKPAKKGIMRDIRLYEDESSCSSFNDDDDGNHNYKMHLSINRDDDSRYLDSGDSSSVSLVPRQHNRVDNQKSTSPRQYNRVDNQKSTSRFSSDISFEYDQDQKISPPKRVSSFKSNKTTLAEPVYSREKDNVVNTQDQSPENWLAQQISRRKLTDLITSSHSLEPKATNIKCQNDISSSTSEFNIDFEEVTAKEYMEQNENLVSISNDNREFQNDISSNTSEFNSDVEEFAAKEYIENQNLMSTSNDNRDIELEEFAAQESMEQNNNLVSFQNTSNNNTDAEIIEMENSRKFSVDMETLLETDNDQDFKIQSNGSYSTITSNNPIININTRDHRSSISSPKDDTTAKGSTTNIENKKERREMNQKNSDSIEGSKRRKKVIKKISKKNKVFDDASTEEESLKDKDTAKRKMTCKYKLDTKNAPNGNGSNMTKNRYVELSADKRILKEKDLKKKKEGDDELRKKMILQRTNDAKDRKKTSNRQNDKTAKKDRTSSKIQSTRRPKQVKKPTRKYDEAVGFEDKSVMSLIDKLKGYELR